MFYSWVVGYYEIVEDFISAFGFGQLDLTLNMKISNQPARRIVSAIFFHACILFSFHFRFQLVEPFKTLYFIKNSMRIQ